MLDRSGKHEPFKPGELPPATVAWLHPIELVRTAYHAWVSHMATSYIDRREVLAALDRAPVAAPTPAPSTGAPPLDEPAEKPARKLDSDPVFDGAHAKNNAVWIDFLADMGDSWEATYAMASLIAQRNLPVRGYQEKTLPPDDQEKGLPHADLVVLGGDLVYPSPTRDSYRRRTCEPFVAAFPQKEVRPPDKTEKEWVIRDRHLVAIPGNHDWYDGLTSFVREFCQGGMLGGWKLLNTRSYFARKLTSRWWIFGTDIALDTRIDPAQQDYFLEVVTNRNIAKHGEFREKDNVILCTAKPSWFPSSRYSRDAYSNLEFVVRELVEKKGKGHVAMILSGDLHHYARYTDNQQHQFITSGSAGSYLMGTHHLPAEVQTFAKPKEDAKNDHVWGYSGFERGDFPYPSQSDSRRLALRGILLAFRRANIAFCVTIGLVYLWLARMLDHVAPGLAKETEMTKRFAIEWSLDLQAILSALVIIVGCAVFAAATNRKSSQWLTAPWGALHGVAQIAVAVLLALLLYPHPLHTIGGPTAEYIELSGYQTISEQLTTFIDSVVFALIGGWVGATLVGIYLTVSDLLLRWHCNEVFAAQSICDYRSFVRIKVEPSNKFTIFPIGVRHVPRSWRSRLVRPLDSDSHYEPTDAELVAHLIEGPIEVNVSQTKWPSGTATSGQVVL